MVLKRYNCITSLLIVIIFFTIFPANAVVADSPSFVRQEIGLENPWNIVNAEEGSIGMSNGSRLLFYEGSNDTMQCTLQDFTLPDLSSVSFVSNGKSLNTTFWLNGQFKQPPYGEDSPFVNDTEIDQRHFTISSLNAAGMNLNQWGNVWPSVLRKTYLNFTLLASNETRLANTNAHTIEFSGIANVSDPIFGTHLVRGLDVLIVRENELYVLTYMAEPKDYSDGLFAAKKMINSFRIGGTISTEAAVENGFSAYSNSQRKFTILYPSNWGKINNTGNEGPIVRFFSPISGPYMIVKAYSIIFEIPSVYGSRTSYTKDLRWTIANSTWIESFGERSLNFTDRTVNIKSGNQTSYQIGDNFVHLPVDLTLMNMPNQYNLIFNAQEGFIKNGRLCAWWDTSNLVSAPPPRFSIIPETNSLSIGPGETKNIQIKVQSHTSIASNVNLDIIKNKNALFNLTLIPTKIFVPPNGSSSATMSISGRWDNISAPAPTPGPLRIAAEITLPQSIEYRLSNSTTNITTPNEPINEYSELVITRLDLGSYSYDIWNHLNPVFTSLLTISTAIIGFIGGRKSIDLFRKKSRKNNEHKKEFDKEWPT
jgi:hypothetical protein